METDIAELHNEIKKLKSEIADLSRRVSSLESYHDTYGPVHGGNSYWQQDEYECPTSLGDSFGEGWDHSISPGPGRHGEW